MSGDFGGAGGARGECRCGVAAGGIMDQSTFGNLAARPCRLMPGIPQ